MKYKIGDKVKTEAVLGNNHATVGEITNIKHDYYEVYITYRDFIQRRRGVHVYRYEHQIYGLVPNFDDLLSKAKEMKALLDRFP